MKSYETNLTAPERQVIQNAIRVLCGELDDGYEAEYQVERYFREKVAKQLAQVPREMNLCSLAGKALGLPKSY